MFMQTAIYDIQHVINIFLQVYVNNYILRVREIFTHTNEDFNITVLNGYIFWRIKYKEWKDNALTFL